MGFSEMVQKRTKYARSVVLATKEGLKQYGTLRDAFRVTKITNACWIESDRFRLITGTRFFVKQFAAISLLLVNEKVVFVMKYQ